MKARLVIAAFLILAVAGEAQAGIFSFLSRHHSSTNLPKASSPVLDRPMEISHKVAYRGKHPGRYNDPMWGTTWDRWLMKDRHYTVPHWGVMD